MPKLAFNWFIEQTFATKTAIIIFCEEGILVWAIPPLSPHSPDHFLDRNPNRLPPLFRIPFPNDTVYPDIRHWRTISSWYFGSWDSIYFDILRLDSTLERFKLIVKPDLSDTSLHVIDSSKPIHNFGNPTLQSCSRICEGTLVSLWHRSNNQKCGVYTGLLSTQFSCDSAIKDRMARPSRSLCPASGRFVYFTCDDDDNVRIVVADLIWFRVFSAGYWELGLLQPGSLSPPKKKIERLDSDLLIIWIWPRGQRLPLRKIEPEGST